MKKIIFPALIALFIACKKEGPGGQNEIVAFPKHHSKTIPGAVVYIKYGTDKFPGDDVSKYDDKAIAEPMPGEPNAHAHFKNLNKGKYYLYGVGYDSAISQIVKGGIPVLLTTKAGTHDVILPITED